ncbi:JmjC domain-containing protein [Rozella allomycis CSF55]|uniref:JmjC domain-containing protein n=1 Tax=Rozella allomycis (strain CSF55) TaxID=988480 RepID=A0A075B3I6_ROZAC|nr:JmjC domain-containing protein [Rozella allomycis CSF55]|eukprot:EPZ36947.1 JmjC domain-containing protein [Rozella allomycis CSF55]
MDLELAPILRPKYDEFKDSIRFISNIYSQISEIGACQVVPPADWKRTTGFECLDHLNQCEMPVYSQKLHLINGLRRVDHGLTQSFVTFIKSFGANGHGKLFFIGKNISCFELSNIIDESQTFAIKEIGLFFEYLLLVKEVKAEALQWGMSVHDFCNSGLVIKVNDSKFVCKSCNKQVYLRELTFCRVCKDRFHSSCVLSISCTNKYYCVRCIVLPGHAFSFEQVEGMTVKEFVQSCDNTVGNELETEKEYWQILDAGCYKALYGANIDYKTLQSGFDDNKNDQWSLLNLPRMSLLKYLANDIPGLTHPWLYFGSKFSTFCWHIEDHSLMSINYLHSGAVKTWYIIPPEYSTAFELCLQKTLPLLFISQPKLLYQMNLILPLDVLKKHGIPVYKINQVPGTFVITFPNCYHSGFNNGFNIAEAVNLALPQWIPFAMQSLNRYAIDQRLNLLSVDEIIIQMIENDEKMSSEIVSILIEQISTEIRIRRALIEKYGEKQKRYMNKHACNNCKKIFFFSYAAVPEGTLCLSCIQDTPEYVVYGLSSDYLTFLLEKVNKIYC